jgi:hypothetical protein
MGKKVLTAVMAAVLMLAGALFAFAQAPAQAPAAAPAVKPAEAGPPQWLKGTPEEKLKALGDIQPGLGTVMIEYAYRMTTMFFAAKGGNWDLADYMIKEAKEIQEVGETTRPGRAEALKAFEKAYLDEKVEPAIKEKSFAKFSKAFDQMVGGCNACHVAQKFPFIQYVRPSHPIAPMKYTR